MKKVLILFFVFTVFTLPSNSAKIRDLSPHSILSAEDYSTRQIWNENNKTFVKVWLKTDNFDNLFFGSNFYYQYDKTQYVFDCTDKNFKITDIAYYSFHDRKINTKNINQNNNTWFDISPNSRYEKMMNLACKQ